MRRHRRRGERPPRIVYRVLMNGTPSPQCQCQQQTKAQLGLIRPASARVGGVHPARLRCVIGEPLRLR
eukprot:6358985-Prymnesium_polylepis.1